MTVAPFMPKATAVWLVENTTLTFKQIAEFCNLQELEIKGIADGDVAKGIKAYNPILAGQLSRDEIETCSKNPEKKLILLNSPSEKYIKWRGKRKYVDDDVRNDVSSFNINEGDSLVTQINKDIQNSDNTKTDNLKKKYFGNEVNQKDIE